MPRTCCSSGIRRWPPSTPRTGGSMRSIVSRMSGEGCGSDDGAGLQAAFESATTVVLTCPGSIRILGTRERAYARLSAAWRADTVRRRTMLMVVILGLVPLLILSMAVGGLDQVWGVPRAQSVRPPVPPIPPVPPVTSLPPSQPVPLIPPVPQVPPIHPLPPVPPRP
jgi:hypothetical protein